MAKKPKQIQDDYFTTFLVEADKDYLLARYVNRLGTSWGSRTGYFAQAACEKYMKALTTQRDKYYLNTHTLTDLAADCTRHSDYFELKDTQLAMEIFEAFEQVGRYGAAASPTKDKGRVDTPEMQVRGAWSWSSNSIHSLDAFVKEVRSMIQIEPHYADNLQGLIEGRKDLMIAVTWEGEIPLREVFLDDNFSFG